MSKTAKVTEPQMRALRAIGKGEVQFSWMAAHAAGYSPWVMPHGLRSQTVQSVIDKGWAERKRSKTDQHYDDVFLTDAGKALVA